MANGIDAFEAQKLRNKNDSIWARNLIESYTFINIAKVTKYDNGYVDCEIGGTLYSHVEVLVIGVNGFGLKLIPAKDDRVLVLAPRTPMNSVKDFDPTFTMPNYDRSGLKCIPLTDHNTDQLISVDKDKIEMTFQSSSQNQTSIMVNKDGVSLTDTNGNVISSASNNISASVSNGCSIEITNSHVLLSGKNGTVEVK